MRLSGHKAGMKNETLKDLVVASHNGGKIREIRALLEPFGCRVISAVELNLPDVDETGTTYKENALLKAHAAAKGAGLPALSDDSGLAVHALHGAPGIFSARWAGEPRSFPRAMARVETELEGKADRSAHFVCVLALAFPDGREMSWEGTVHGDLVWPPRGDKGFGYDPVFVPSGHDITFGEMDPGAKHAMSHRAMAFKGFVRDMFSGDG